MRRLRIFLGAALLGLGLAARAGASSLPKEADDFFKWGEYDSLAAKLETWLTVVPVPSDHIDSVTLAKANLYMGVAYYATGKAAQSDSAFLRACRFEKGIQLDKFYVTNEIMARFDALASEEEKRLSRPPRIPVASVQAGTSATRAVQGSPRPASPITPSSPISPTSKNGPVLESREMGWVWLGSGALIAVTAGTAYYFLSQKSPPKEVVTEVDVH